MIRHSLFEKPVHVYHLPKKYVDESMMVVTGIVLLILFVFLLLSFIMPPNTM